MSAERRETSGAGAGEWPAPRLQEYGPGGSGRVHRLPVGSDQLAGRDAKCTICLEDKAASRKSAVLCSRHDGVWVKACVGIDGDPTNGVHVNDEELLPGVKCLLRHYDVVRIGDTELRLYYPDLGGNKTQPNGRRPSIPTEYRRLKGPFRELIERNRRLDGLLCREMDEYVGKRLGLEPETARRCIAKAAAWAKCEHPRGAARYQEVAQALLRGF